MTQLNPLTYFHKFNFVLNSVIFLIVYYWMITTFLLSKDNEFELNNAVTIWLAYRYGDCVMPRHTPPMATSFRDKVQFPVSYEYYMQ